MIDSTRNLAIALEQRSTGVIILEATFAVILSIASFIGNILVCLAVYRNSRLHTIPNLFVVALAITDLLVAVLSMPFSASILVKGRWLFDKEYKFCMFMGFSLFQCGISSLQMLCQIAMNRYFCIVRPNIYRNIYTRKKAKYIIIISWVFALSVTIPPFVMHPGQYTFQPGKAMCLYPMETNKAFTVLLIIVFIATPMNIIAYSYYKVYRTVGASNKNFKVPRQANNQENHRLASNVEEAKVTRTLTAVVAAFAFCWLPIGVIDSIDVIQGETTLPRQVYLMYGFLVYLSSTVNPFIYGVFSRTFRREYRKLVCGKRNQVFTANAESMIHQGNSGNHTLTTTMQ